MEPGKTVAKAARVLEVINKYRKNPSGVAVENKKTDSRLRYIRVMTIRHSTLSVSWYEGVYHKVSVEAK